MIRIKGDIIRQLNEIYENIYFKQKYKEELKERILSFVDIKLMRGEENIVEKLKNSYKYMQIEEHEINVIKDPFIKEFKEEMFNYFNPLWYSNINKTKKNISKEAFVYLLKEIMNLYDKNTKNKFNYSFFNSTAIYYIINEMLYIYSYEKENNKIDINIDKTQHVGLNIEKEEIEKTILFFKKHKKIGSLRNFEKYLNDFEYYLEKVGSSYIFSFNFYEGENEIKEVSDSVFDINKIYEIVYLIENKKEVCYLVDPKTREYKETNKKIRDLKSSEIIREKNNKEIILFFNLMKYLFQEKKYEKILSNEFKEELETKFNELFNQLKEENKKYL